MPFLAVTRIRKAAANSPWMAHGERGAAVAVVQGALIDLGYKMPISTRKSGSPDGIYGKEMKGVVKQFQSDEKLKGKDGIAGRYTIAKLDALLFSKKSPSKTKAVKLKPAAPPPPGDRNYKIGTGNPIITPDIGAGAFNSESTEASMWALKQAIFEILPPRGNSAVLIIGPDAARNMVHYLNASGFSLKIDLESMINSGATAKAHFKNEVRQAQIFTETLSVGKHSITSKTAESAYNYKNETYNWFFAVGGYSTWGKGTAIVTKGTSGLEYELSFEYKFFDRYNWDSGKKVNIGPIEITDEFMGDFHRQGLAREFDMVATIKRNFHWKQGEAIPEEQYRSGSGR